MTSFGYWGGTEADENGKIWTNVSDNYNINDNTLIRNSSYNGPNIYSRYIYIYIDKNNDKIFSTVNDNQIKNDKKIEQLNEEGKKRMEEISDLNSRMNRLQTENDKNKKEIRDLKETNEILTEREKKEQERKKVKEKNRKTVNEQFSKDKDDIKSKKIGEYKKEIDKFLIEIYIIILRKRKERINHLHP